MPTKREREYYQQGFQDGAKWFEDNLPVPRETYSHDPVRGGFDFGKIEGTRKPKRKLSAWNKFVKANSKKPRFRMRSGKLNLKKMAVAFRKTPAGRKRKK